MIHFFLNWIEIALLGASFFCTQDEIQYCGDEYNPPKIGKLTEIFKVTEKEVIDYYLDYDNGYDLNEIKMKLELNVTRAVFENEKKKILTDAITQGRSYFMIDQIIVFMTAVCCSHPFSIYFMSLKSELNDVISMQTRTKH
jgi:hypothetical protein